MLDLHILPSAYGEAFPNVVEAMACETPCVVTDVGDAAYIVGDTGWVVPPNDAEALASAIEKALKERHKGQWQQLCLSARQRIQQHFDIQKMISACMNCGTKPYDFRLSGIAALLFIALSITVCLPLASCSEGSVVSVYSTGCRCVVSLLLAATAGSAVDAKTFEKVAWELAQGGLGEVWTNFSGPDLFD